MRCTVGVTLCVLFLSCSVKRDMVVPVLLDYQLDYPEEARRQGMEGTVHVRALVNRSGRVEEAAIAGSSGNYVLDSAALRTARTFKFSPAMRDEKTIQAWVLVPVEFKFRDIDRAEWFFQVEKLHRKIDRDHDASAVAQLYELYRQMIFAPSDATDLESNRFIKEVVVERARVVWDGYWSVYPARVVLFIDIVNRYPDSFTALVARSDLARFLEQEGIKMRHSLGVARADTLVSRIQEAIRY
ncbi:energy transducer TonB [candidate division WOR-3 bacterium]|nr:energy transducer TonB [candidate division WOR-3 bacterium]